MFSGALAALTAVLILMASRARAQGDSSSGPVGGSSQHLVVIAVRFAHASWDPRACLGSVEFEQNQTIDDGAGTWDFGFIVPGGNRRVKVAFMGAGAPFLVDSGLQGMSVDCIREMSIDSHRAFEIAMKHGLEYSGALLHLKLFLAEPGDFSDGDSLLSRRPELQGRTIWQVATERPPVVLIDAKTGHVLDQESEER